MFLKPALPEGEMICLILSTVMAAPLSGVSAGLSPAVEQVFVSAGPGVRAVSRSYSCRILQAATFPSSFFVHIYCFLLFLFLPEYFFTRDDSSRVLRAAAFDNRG